MTATPVVTLIPSVRSSRMPSVSYDMTGNANEMIGDWYDGSYYSESPWNKPSGPGQDSDCIFQGGLSRIRQRTPERQNVTSGQSEEVIKHRVPHCAFSKVAESLIRSTRSKNVLSALWKRDR